MCAAEGVTLHTGRAPVWPWELRQCNRVNGIIRVYRSGWLQWRRALRCLMEHPWQLPCPDPTLSSDRSTNLGTCRHDKLSQRHTGIIRGTASSLKGTVAEKRHKMCFTVQGAHKPRAEGNLLARGQQLWPEGVSGWEVKGLLDYRENISCPF